MSIDDRVQVLAVNGGAGEPSPLGHGVLIHPQCVVFEPAAGAQLEDHRQHLAGLRVLVKKDAHAEAVPHDVDDLRVVADGKAPLAAVHLTEPALADPVDVAAPDDDSDAALRRVFGTASGTVPPVASLRGAGGSTTDPITICRIFGGRWCYS